MRRQLAQKELRERRRLPRQALKRFGSEAADLTIGVFAIGQKNETDAFLLG